MEHDVVEWSFEQHGSLDFADDFPKSAERSSDDVDPRLVAPSRLKCKSLDTANEARKDAMASKLGSLLRTEA